MLKVDEPSQLVTVETSLRMTWVDPRLEITIPNNFPTNYIRFGPDVLKYIWIPDVYIDGLKDLRMPAYKVSFYFYISRQLRRTIFFLDLYLKFDIVNEIT